jgi:hypothetical protein
MRQAIGSGPARCIGGWTLRVQQAAVPSVGHDSMTRVAGNFGGRKAR